MKTVSTFLFLIYVGIIHAQTSNIDSLSRLISKATTDTARINLAIQKIGSFVEINLDSAISLSHKTIEEAKRVGYRKGEANARRKLAISYCYKGEYSAAKENLNISETLFTSLKDSSGLGAMFGDFGIMYDLLSKYDSAILYYQKAIRLAQLIDDNDLLNRIYGNIAISYQMQSDYPQALMYLQKALKYSESKNDVNSQAYIALNMGIVYDNMGDTLRAEKAMLKSIEFAKISSIRNVELYAYSNLSSLYANSKKIEKSYEYAMKAAALGVEMGDAGIQSSSLSRASRALASQEKFAQAETLGRKAIAIADSSRQPLNIFQTYSGMGLILKMQEKYIEAIPYYEAAFGAISEADIYDEEVAACYDTLSVCYEQVGNYAKALSAHKTSSKIVDSIRSRENIRKATELAMNYEFQKKEEIARAQQLQRDAIARTRQLALGLGLACTILLAAVTFYAYRNKQQANKLLSTQKREIERTLTELRNTQKQLIESEKMASLGELTAGIAHEIQNPLNFVNNFSEVNTELIAEARQELEAGNIPGAFKIMNEMESNEEKISQHGKRADSIVKSMMEHSRMSTGVKRPTDVNALVGEYVRLANHGMRAKDKAFNFFLETQFDNTIGKINLVPEDLGRVIINLCNNAFFSVNEKKKQQGDGYQPTVSISTRKDGDKIQICIRDNGNGISQKILGKIYQPFFTTKPAGQGTGLGLSLSYDIITKEHGGVLKVDSKEGEYAEFIIELPV